MFQCHVNIEWCNGSRAIKYLFKYINKGPDRTTMVIQNSGNHEASVNYKKEPRNEIKEYLDCKYLSACEACWRIFQFEIQYRSPSVIALQVHLPGQQAITLSDKQYLPDLLRREDLQHTMFIQWMHMNEIDPEARQLTYAEFPTKFVWNKCIREWDDNKNDWVRKNYGQEGSTDNAPEESYMYIQLLEKRTTRECC